MGCGVSKFDPEELGPTCKFEPTILKPGVEDIRKEQIKPVILVSNLSFKHLINANVKSTSAADDQSYHLMKNNVSLPIVKEESRHDIDNYVKIVDRSDDEFGDEKCGGFERKDSLVDAPGSPSFRDYCLINGHTSIHDGEENSGATNVRSNVPKKRAINSNITSRKGSITPVEKNGRSRKWRKPGNAPPKNGSKSVKHLWHVSTCYNPNFPRSQDNPEKTQR